MLIFCFSSSFSRKTILHQRHSFALCLEPTTLNISLVSKKRSPSLTCIVGKIDLSTSERHGSLFKSATGVPSKRGRDLIINGNVKVTSYAFTLTHALSIFHVVSLVSPGWRRVVCLGIKFCSVGPQGHCLLNRNVAPLFPANLTRLEVCRLFTHTLSKAQIAAGGRPNIMSTFTLK
jgi:hypothetical protein